MFFKALSAYRATLPLALSPEALSERLAKHQSRRCGPLEADVIGWTQPLGKHGDLYIHPVNGNIMLTLKRYQKKIPTAALKEEVDIEVTKIEEEQDRKVRSRERKEIKQSVIERMLPSVPQAPSLLHAYVDPMAGLLLIDTASSNQAEDLINLLRICLGTLPAIPANTNESRLLLMTQWVNTGQMPEDFTLGSECKLSRDKEGEAVCRHLDLSSDEVQAHINAGMYVEQLALTYQDRISFTLDADMTISKLKFLDAVHQDLDDIETDDEITRFDADFTIMAGELRQMLAALWGAFGGLEQMIEEAA